MARDYGVRKQYTKKDIASLIPLMRTHTVEMICTEMGMTRNQVNYLSNKIRAEARKRGLRFPRILREKSSMTLQINEVLDAYAKSVK